MRFLPFGLSQVFPNFLLRVFLPVNLSIFLSIIDLDRDPTNKCSILEYCPWFIPPTAEKLSDDQADKAGSIAGGGKSNQAPIFSITNSENLSSYGNPNKGTIPVSQGYLNLHGHTLLDLAASRRKRKNEVSA